MSKEYFVLMENDQPVGVAPLSREAMVKEWQTAVPNRRAVKVEECT